MAEQRSRILRPCRRRDPDPEAGHRRVASRRPAAAAPARTAGHSTQPSRSPSAPTAEAPTWRRAAAATPWRSSTASRRPPASDSDPDRSATGPTTVGASTRHHEPSLSGLSLSPTRFRAADRGPSIATTRANRRITVSYRLSEPARVTFTVQRKLPGRRAGKRCLKPTPLAKAPNAVPGSSGCAAPSSTAARQTATPSASAAASVAASCPPPGPTGFARPRGTPPGNASSAPRHKSFRIHSSG